MAKIYDFKKAKLQKIIRQYAGFIMLVSRLWSKKKHSETGIQVVFFFAYNNTQS